MSKAPEIPEQKFLHSLPEKATYTIVRPDGVFTVHDPDDELDLMFGSAFSEDGELLGHQVEKAHRRVQFTEN